MVRTRLSIPSLLGRFLGEQSDDDDVNEVEMLLEAYFIQVDNTHNKLQTLHEYIDDTEVRRLILTYLNKQCFASATPSAGARLLMRHPSKRQ